MIGLVWLLGLANLAGWGTWFAGWWVVPVVALVGGVLAPKQALPVVTATLGPVLGWAALLYRDSRAAGFSVLLDLLTQLLPVRPGVLMAMTLGLGVALAGGAALIGAALRRRDEPSA